MKNIILHHKIKNDKYTEYIYEAFDIQNKEESNVEIQNNIDLNFDWQIGVIYGGSGSGKTTLLKTFGEIKKPNFNNYISLISNFDWIEPKEATYLLSSMGLSSVPTWLRPFNTLSNGEQYRASLAYVVGKAQENEIILIDEYTSVVDRDVAKAMSFALQKYIRRTNKKIILASCHFDIMEWLTPDWIYSPNKGRVERHEYLRQRPEIKLEIFRCRYEAWKLFKHHHYLSNELNEASKCFLAMWNNKPVAFIAILPFPSGYVKNAVRGTRTVVLPDYQGLGIGYYFTNYIASLYKKEDYRYFVKGSNPALGEKRLQSKDWRETSKSRKIFSEKASNDMSNNFWGFNKKNMFYAFEYVGEKSNDDSSIITFKSEIFKDISQNQLNLF